MGVTKTLVAVCAGCGDPVLDEGITQKDLEAEVWYKARFRQTGSLRYEPKLWWHRQCERDYWKTKKVMEALSEKRA